MSDTEDPRQSRGLFGERLAALDDDRLHAASRQLVSRREPTDSSADDDHGVFHRGQLCHNGERTGAATL